MKYIYFVSYTHNRGAGNCELVTESPIDDYEDIRKITDNLNGVEKWADVVIMNFILLRKEPS